ncbi:MAG: hypothetical protein A2091_00020 [Desulfuromonadales bacterium GWD2_61_12]|nr:MAG: hypothetical protein A2005_04905 [Desulfuromonadales bacterium GWC2_61_20]OGR33122.1 MAG: hypothetical protein A2091_00020 [Desulfuromonadales bacterium GWD2_61_12]HBT82181.1 hypothetical protein [Desulfuromonas sp.]
MQRFLDDLRSMPGVTGACVYHGADGVRFNNLPALFKPERLGEVGALLGKISAAGRLSFPDLSEFVLCYEESLLLCRPLSAQESLIVACDPAINMSLLTMSINQGLDDLAARPLPAVVPVAAPLPPPAAPLENLRESGPLAKPLQVMASQLAKILGPMAFIVFDETLAAWQTSQPPTLAGLNKLLDSLCREIGDPEKARLYRELVRKQLGATSG